MKCLNHTCQDRHTLKVVARFNAQRRAEDVPEADTSSQERKSASAATLRDTNLSRRVTPDDDTLEPRSKRMPPLKELAEVVYAWIVRHRGIMNIPDDVIQNMTVEGIKRELEAFKNGKGDAYLAGLFNLCLMDLIAKGLMMKTDTGTLLTIDEYEKASQKKCEIEPLRCRDKRFPESYPHTR